MARSAAADRPAFAATRSRQPGDDAAIRLRWATVRWVWIFLGGGLGSVGRVALGQWVFARAGASWPWHTFAVNVLGCLAIGALAAWLDERGGPHAAHPLLIAGFLGGFTTFSTFGLETLQLLEAARPAAAALNALATLGACLLAVALGFALVRSWA